MLDEILKEAEASSKKSKENLKELEKEGSKASCGCAADSPTAKQVKEMQCKVESAKKQASGHQ